MTLPAFRLPFPGYVTTTRELARAMSSVAQRGPARAVLATRDINALGAAPR